MGERKKYYNNLDILKVVDNTRFWETMKPLFNEKSASHQIKYLITNGRNVSEDEGDSSERK